MLALLLTALQFVSAFKPGSRNQLKRAVDECYGYSDYVSCSEEEVSCSEEEASSSAESSYASGDLSSSAASLYPSLVVFELDGIETRTSESLFSVGDVSICT